MVKSLTKIKVPVPPVEVQCEIVRILDLFSALKAELEAELEARLRQYAHYRNLLFGFSGCDVPRVAMGSSASSRRGRRFTKTDLMRDGVPAIHYGEIYTHYGVAASSTISHVRGDMRNSCGSLSLETWYSLLSERQWRTSRRLSPGLARSQWPSTTTTFSFRSDLNPKYVSYFAQTASFHGQKKRYVARAKVKRLSGESLAKIEIPVPSPEEQQRVVTILDKFDTLAQRSH